MPRTVTPAMLTALKASTLRPAVLVSIQTVTEVVYIWSGLGRISWNGQSWIGLGSLLGISLLEDGSTVEARGMSISLSGLDPDLLADCLGDFHLGLPVNLYLALFASDGTLIADPLCSWSGRSDMPTIDVSATTATIDLQCESRLMDMNVASDRRYTLADSQLDNPGDLSFSFVAGITEIQINWGQLPLTSNTI